VNQIITLFSIILFCIALIACTGETESPQPAPDQMVFDAGQQITSATFETLSTQLSRAIEEGGIPYALEFCNVEAIPLTEELARQYDTHIRRATHKPRNPANRVDTEELDVVETYIEALETGTGLTPKIHRKEDHIRYFAPIRMGMDLCMQCHGNPGTDIDESNLNLIRSLYPDDEATGFSMGELRGIWSVNLPADSASVRKILEMLQ